MKLDPYVILLTEMNLKRIKNLKRDIRNCKTARRKLRDKLLDIGLGNDFLDPTPKAYTNQ